MKPILVLLDEEIGPPIIYYVKALEESGFKVIQVTDIGGGERALEQAGVETLVIDIMMPCKEYEDIDETKGLRTGVYFYQAIRRKYPALHIMILTNMADENTLNEFGSEPLLDICLKTDYGPFRFAERALAFLQSGRS